MHDTEFEQMDNVLYSDYGRAVMRSLSIPKAAQVLQPKGTLPPPPLDRERVVPAALPSALRRGPSLVQALASRRVGGSAFMRRRGRSTAALAAGHVPNARHATAATLDGRAYTGQFSKSGDLFVSAGQADVVTLYDTSDPFAWTPHKRIQCPNMSWTITSVDVHPQERFMAYTTMDSTMYLVNIGGSTELHKELPLSARAGTAAQRAGSTGPDSPAFDPAAGGTGNPDSTFSPYDQMLARLNVFQAKFSGTGAELLAACGGGAIMVYDVERDTTTHCVPAHHGDINAVAWADPSPGCNIVLSGGDDRQVKVWDRRTMGRYEVDVGGTPVYPRPAGYLPGHLQGITSLAGRGDGRYVVSNGKDHTAKVWDLRNLVTPATYDAGGGRRAGGWYGDYDYRWGEWPGWGDCKRHPMDASVLTLRGHDVTATLMRAYFSPLHSTGGAFIYTGSFSHGVVVYDALTGGIVDTLAGHDGAPVRDASWHPSHAVLASSGFDGTVQLWHHTPTARDDVDSRRTQRQEALAAALEARAGAGDAAADAQPDHEAMLMDFTANHNVGYFFDGAGRRRYIVLADAPGSDADEASEHGTEDSDHDGDTPQAESPDSQAK